MTGTIEPMAASLDQRKLAEEVVEKARVDGIELVGPDRLLTGLTESVLETALEAEISDHLGYDKHDPISRDGLRRGHNGARARLVPVGRSLPRMMEACGDAATGTKEAPHWDSRDHPAESDGRHGSESHPNYDGIRHVELKAQLRTEPRLVHCPDSRTCG